MRPAKSGRQTGSGATTSSGWMGIFHSVQAMLMSRANESFLLRLSDSRDRPNGALERELAVLAGEPRRCRRRLRFEASAFHSEVNAVRLDRLEERVPVGEQLTQIVFRQGSV